MEVMTSLTIEMGLRRRRTDDEPPVPDAVASRDDVTLAQKQRLAMLAKMGLGPVADPSIRSPMPAMALVGSRDIALPQAPSSQKAALLEKERRFREQEEDQQDLFEAARKAKPKPARPVFPGFQRLGPVQAREEDKLQFLPSPAQLEQPKPKAEAPGITIKPIERSKVPPAAPGEGDGAEEPRRREFQEQPGGDSTEGMSAERAILAFLEMQKRKKAKAAEREAEEQRQKREKKKLKKAHVQADRDNRREDDDDDEEEEDDAQAHDREEHRREKHSKEKGPVMVVESVKGKVSTANKGMTDADLERRFLAQERQDRGSLMTEEQVLRMIRREKTERPAAGSASRRIQKELAEWEAAKVQQRARVKSPTRFERMVVARR